MLAELHLAEDAFALHLLLQHLESLVDIVVADENLHASFLLDRTLNSRTDKPLGPRHQEHRICQQWICKQWICQQWICHERAARTSADIINYK